MATELSGCILVGSEEETILCSRNNDRELEETGTQYCAQAHDRTGLGSNRGVSVRSPVSRPVAGGATGHGKRSVCFFFLFVNTLLLLEQVQRRQKGEGGLCPRLPVQVEAKGAREVES